MEEQHYPPSSVVVGIDGSSSALAAALWSVDEALGADVPLRLVYAIDPDQVRELVATHRSSALHDAGCSVLICGSETYSVSQSNGHGRKERVAW